MTPNLGLHEGPRLQPLFSPPSQALYPKLSNFVQKLKTLFFEPANIYIFSSLALYKMAKTEIIYPKNVGASVAMNFI